MLPPSAERLVPSAAARRSQRTQSRGARRRQCKARVCVAAAAHLNDGTHAVATRNQFFFLAIQGLGYFYRRL